MLLARRHWIGQLLAPACRLTGPSFPFISFGVERPWPVRRFAGSFRIQNDRDGNSGSSNTASYQYHPLNDASTTQPRIRLLELLPGSGPEPVTSRLRDVNLSDSLHYEAISYCWGDPGDIRAIFCNGQLLSVPRRLEIALKHMRYPHKTRVLWADAICINQTDNTEKEVQVQLMRKIFSRAQRTLIWIGDTTERSQQRVSRFALWTIKFGLVTLKSRLRQIQSPGIPILNTDEGTAKTVTPFSSDFYLELIGLLRMPWFQRAWVVQEVAVSTKATLFWGPLQYEWDDVVRALKFMSKMDFPLAFIVTLEHISAIEDERKFYQSEQNRLYSVLLRHQRCLATDLRDKIYSFSGLVETSSQPRTPVRITYQHDAATVYHRTALDILKTDQNLDLLCRPPTTANFGLEVPSWVPDWSTSSSSTLTYSWGHGPLSLAGTELGNVCRFKTAGNSKYTFKHAESEKVLEIEGHVFDRILSTSPIYQGVQVPYTVRYFPDIVKQWFRCIRTLLVARKVFKAWQRLASTHSKTRYLPTGETIREVFLQTMSTAEVNDAGIENELRLWEKSSRPVIGLPYAGWAIFWHFISNKPFLLFKIHGRYALQRRMVKTENGYLGLAGGVAEVGDYIVIAKGSSVPLIFKKIEHGEGWTLVGDIYVHGIMNGEVFQEEKCQKMHIY